jgi:cysteine synthase
MADLHARGDVLVLHQGSEPGLIDHYRLVAAEILDELPRPGAIAVGIGTGLSIYGHRRKVRNRGSSCRGFGVEPEEAAIASGRPGYRITSRGWHRRSPSRSASTPCLPAS